MTVQAGTHILIRGTSGSGKSTFLRALAGIWPFAKGKVTLAPQDRLMFIPQRPYLPLGMLMYGKEASNRKQEIDRQHYTIPNQRPKDKHCGKI
jgi:ABC-type uncharacterized transport system, permease and ATPase components